MLYIPKASFPPPSCDMEDDYVVLDAPIHEKDRIGGGAYGAVYKVKLNGTSCIAKRLHDILTGSRGEEAVPEGQWRVLLAKFNQECDHLKRMKHPNIVQFLGVYRPGDNPSDIALVMERLHMDLASLVNSYGRLLSPKPNDTFISLKLHILMDVSCGLAHMHSHGLVHRDLNDGNVLLTETLEAKIADLGMARIIIDDPMVKRSGRLTVAPGAQDFMPPEALQKNPIYGDKLDIFSLGHLMLFLMTCIYPRPDISRKYQRTNWMSVEALKRRNSLDHIGRRHILYDLIIRCLEDDPKDRPSIMIVKDELKRHCRGHQKTLEMVLTLLDKRRVSYKDEIQQIKDEMGKQPNRDDLTKTLSQVQDKYRLLEDQLMNKTEIETEVDKLRQDLESERNSKQHFMSAFNCEKVKVTVLEQEKMKLEGVVKMGLAEKAQLQQFIAQEQARMEEEMNKSRNANKVLREKLQAAEAQLAHAYQSQPHHRPSGSPHITPSGPPQGHIHQGGHAPHISERRNYPSTGNIGGYHQGSPAQATTNESHSHMIVSSAGQSDYPHHNEQQQYSDGHDMPPPQLNLQQMQQYFRHALQQREQQQQLEELYRVRGEEYRRRDEDLRRMQEEQAMRGAIADRELAELEELKREMAERKPVKPLPSHYQYSSRNEEMVSGANQPMNKEKKSDEIPENELLAGIDDEIRYYAEEVRRMSRPPNKEEVMREDDEDSSLPYDPNLVCPKCGKKYRIGQIQYLRVHLEELCPLLNKE